ncbi:winged helix-turn-helix domain-containing protein [Actinacidiphila acidipaludis]|uniref:Winged helix-turn-helix domain-containing protein n=1 Tax=Actinacidiphila acidipaludis TaxID=2873382 RepID=A0ABS7Q0F4_9ACTN|nr:winged helix-turn-helix domain-containing protein [Streptomyces acidipaludis]MBY8876468.1 winged helix-turn-helix domain-containing protein [Streptomyces acidipaludis]
MDTHLTADPGASGLAALAGLLADETRAAVCLALLDRRARTGAELARYCGVAPSTMSEHLSRLVDGGLLVRERQGRHGYVRLAGPDAAAFVEDLAARVAAPVSAPAGGLRAHSAGRAMARGRTCYDHLAGRLGVAVTDAMTARGMLRQDTGFALTEDGVAWLTGLGADLAGRPSSRRPLARSCLDWTERRPHLAGTAGAELCRLVLDRGWARRVGTGRAVRATPLGERELARTLGIPAGTLDPEGEG